MTTSAARRQGVAINRTQWLVLAVPPPALARELAHGRLAWVFWHRQLTPEQILRDQPKPAT
jgi:hypothetical protein